MENIRIRPFRARQVGQWLACGFRLWRRRPLSNSAPYAVLALFMLILHAIPIIGDVALLLLLPSVLSSALLHIHLTSKPEPAAGQASRGRVRKPPLQDRFVAWWKQVLPAWFGAWSRHENVFPLLIIGFVLIVLGLAAHVLFNKIGGQALTSTNTFMEMGLALQARLLLAYLGGILFWLLVGMTVLWALPLFVVRDMNLVTALKLGLRAVMQNPGIVIAWLVLLAMLLVPGMLLRLDSVMLGTVVLWLGMSLSLTLFTFSGYCGFRLVFAEDTGARVPANNPAMAPYPVRKRS